MYGVPSDLLWDPAGEGPIESDWIEDGFIVAAVHITVALPPRPAPPLTPGVVESIWVATSNRGSPRLVWRRFRLLPVKV